MNSGADKSLVTNIDTKNDQKRCTWVGWSTNRDNEIAKIKKIIIFGAGLAIS